MRTVNFGQMTVIGMVFNEGLCNMDFTVSYLCYPVLWSDTGSYRLSAECRVSTRDSERSPSKKNS